jgi:hypothetical protein
MKIAGRKNDGAWFRTNKVLQDIRTSTEGSTTLIASIKANTALWPLIQSAFAEVQSYASNCGVNIAGSITTADTWLGQMVTFGIPRQVWYGRYTFMTYSRVANHNHVAGDSKPPFIYTPDFGVQLFAMAKVLRLFMKNYVFAARGWNDLTDETANGLGNPGKNPNADPLTFVPMKTAAQKVLDKSKKEVQVSAPAKSTPNRK